jgi:hypothetical protein
MANSFNVVDWLAQESLRILTNKLAVAAIFNTDYNKEFRRAFAPGEIVRVPYPKRFRTRTGLTYNPQAIDSRHTTVTVDDVFGVDFEWDSVQAALQLERPSAEFAKNYLKEPMETIAQTIEDKAAQFAYQHANNIVGQLGTNPTSFDTSSAAARERMVNLACPVTGDRSMIVTPSIMRALKNASISYFNPVTDISKQFRTGIVGSGDGFEWYESVSLYRHTAGTWAGAVTVSGAGQSGDTLLLNCTSGDTFLKGDVFSIDGVQMVNPRTRRVTSPATDKPFVITESVTASASTVTVTISPPIYGPSSVYQNVDALPGNSATVTLFPGTTAPNGKVGSNSLALHRDAFALVGVELEVPKAAEMASQKRDPETGISVRFVRMFDPVQSKMVNRFDVLMGFGVLYGDECAVRVLGS